MNKIHLKIAGIINLFTALIHLIAGQMDLVNPLLNGGLSVQQKGEWMGVWHMVTILLFFTSYIIIKADFGKLEAKSIPQLQMIGWLYILLGVPFIVSSIWFGVFAPQWILLMPIGGLVLMTLRKNERK